MEVWLPTNLRSPKTFDFAALTGVVDRAAACAHEAQEREFRLWVSMLAASRLSEDIERNRPLALVKES